MSGALASMSMAAERTGEAARSSVPWESLPPDLVASAVLMSAGGVPSRLG